VKLINKLIDKKSSSILIVVFGIIMQFVVLFVSWYCVPFSNSSSIIKTVDLILSVILFFIPLISVIGIIVSMKQISRQDKISIPLLGLVLNMCWFLLFLFICYMIFIKGVSV